MVEISELHPILEASSSDSGNVSRILRPIEFEELIKQFIKRKVDYVGIPIAILMTGMRYIEIQRLIDHPEWHIYNEKIIDPGGIRISNKKRTKGSPRARVIYLSDYGNDRIKNFLTTYVNRRLPNRDYFNEVLEKLAVEIGFPILPREVTMTAYILDENGNKVLNDEGAPTTVNYLKEFNTTAITEKSLRKTWVSWLMTIYPQFEARITESMGHSPTTSRRYYQTYRFSDYDIEMMEKYVKGFVPERLLK